MFLILLMAVLFYCCLFEDDLRGPSPTWTTDHIGLIWTTDGYMYHAYSAHVICSISFSKKMKQWPRQMTVLCCADGGQSMWRRNRDDQREDEDLCRLKREATKSFRLLARRGVGYCSFPVRRIESPSPEWRSRRCWWPAVVVFWTGAVFGLASLKGHWKRACGGWRRKMAREGIWILYIHVFLSLSISIFFKIFLSKMN